MSALDELKSRAEQMRREGASMAEIARAVQRSVSTIHVWAAQGGWRIAEIEEEGLEGEIPLPLMGRVGDPSGSAGWGEAPATNNPPTPTPPHQGEGNEFAPPARDPRSMLHSSSSGSTGGPRSHRDPPIKSEGDAVFFEVGDTPLSPLDAARALQQRAAWLGQAGQIRAAEAAARLAERILRTEAVLMRLDAASPASDPDAEARAHAEAHAELKRRFERFRTMHLDALAKDPGWTPRPGASQAEQTVFALCHGQRLGGVWLERLTALRSDGWGAS